MRRRRSRPPVPFGSTPDPWAGLSLEEITALAVQPPPEGTEPDWSAGPDTRWKCRECGGLRVGTFPCTSDQCYQARVGEASVGQSRRWAQQNDEIDAAIHAESVRRTEALKR